MIALLAPLALLLTSAGGLCASPADEGDAPPATDDTRPRGGYEVSGPFAVLPERERAVAVNRMLADRLDRLLPALMRETGIDMWLVLNREYAEDPVYLTLVPEPVFAARRTTMLVFFDRGPERGVERLTVSRYALGDVYESAWDGGSDDEQWARLAEVVAERDPKRIGVNTSAHWAFGDGLSSGLRARLETALGDDLAGRLTPAEALCIRWLETRTALEMQVYPQLVHLARSVIAEGFSSEVITPGVTTTDDVRWFLRQRFTDLGLPAWFMPYCNVQREGLLPPDGTSFYGANGVVIERGDVLHTDVGIRYLRLHTDTQEMAYVLRVGEDEVPAGLQRAMAIGNRWQDQLTDSFVLGRTGNEILSATRRAAKADGIVCSVYTHPLGFYGHAAGPTIGMWDNQGPTPIRGDWPLHADTCYAIEGNVLVPVPEWGGQPVQMKLEQDAWFDGESVHYIGGRQTTWHVVR
ncbi:MAG: M24 family metallopeptidase [Planctomycetota bacterium]